MHTHTHTLSLSFAFSLSHTRTRTHPLTHPHPHKHTPGCTFSRILKIILATRGGALSVVPGVRANVKCARFCSPNGSCEKSTGRTCDLPGRKKKEKRGKTGRKKKKKMSRSHGWRTSSESDFVFLVEVANRQLGDFVSY